MHGRPEEPGTAERCERPHAMRDRVTIEGDLGIAFTGEQPAAGIARTVE